MRVYLATTLTELPGILDAGEIAPVPLRGYAVTPALREAYASGDEEELEYVAMLAAARESLRLLAADKAAPRRRVVLAADVPDAGAIPVADDEPAAVLVSAAIPLPKVASGHVDDDAAEADVAAAAAASAAADAGVDDAQFTVDGAEGHELGWYATQELRHLPGRFKPSGGP